MILRFLNPVATCLLSYFVVKAAMGISQPDNMQISQVRRQRQNERRASFLNKRDGVYFNNFGSVRPIGDWNSELEQSQNNQETEYWCSEYEWLRQNDVHFKNYYDYYHYYPYRVYRSGKNGSVCRASRCALNMKNEALT